MLEAGTKVRRKDMDRKGIVVARLGLYYDVYEPAKKCIMSWPAAVTEELSKAYRCYVCGHAIRGWAAVVPWGGEERNTQLVCEECMLEAACDARSCAECGVRGGG